MEKQTSEKTNVTTAPEVIAAPNILSSAQFWMLFSGILMVLLVAMALYYGVPARNGSPQNQAAGSPTATATVTATASPNVTAPVTPKPDQILQTANANVMEYISEELGITFKYTKKSGTQLYSVKREGNKIYVYSTSTDYKQGQYVEVFTKENSVSFASALQTRFLTGYSNANCFLTTQNLVGAPAGYEAKRISTPIPQDMEDFDKKLALCPPKYTSSNGISYFEAAAIRPDRFVYLSIGQYAIPGDTTSNMWQDTLRFLPQ